MPLELTAFLVGSLSALSLPLGAITAGFWRPGNRVLGFLMAFGGGGLLAALTIDLVNSALERGHAYPLIGGCIAGGLLFVGLNQLINQRGGFLRKASTTFSYMRTRKRARMRKILEQLERLEVFRDLPQADVDEVASHLVEVEFKPGATIYRRQDPCSHLNILESGTVDVHLEGGDGARRVGRHDVFGIGAFFTGAPHSTTAVAKSHVRLWRLPRATFESLLHGSSELCERVDSLLESDWIERYLEDRHGINAAEREAWRAEGRVRETNRLRATATPGTVDAAVFAQAANDIRRTPIFRDLPSEELHRIADALIVKDHEKGHAFFHRGEVPQRMYIVASGETGLMDPTEGTRSNVHFGQHTAFGHLAFLTGRTFTTSVSALGPTRVWVLRRREFDDLLASCPTFRRNVERFLESEEIEQYLVERHAVDREQHAKWVRRAVRNMDDGLGIPSMKEATRALETSGNVALAIWLGILLDGIPESLVIGAGMLHTGQVSLALVAGVFLSNYPEALSSSVGMRAQGWSFARTFWMWASLMLITGLGAMLGSSLRGVDPVLFSVIEGVAAGSMLTMIADTMLPEAYHKGGNIVGFSTLLGFLAAILVSTLGGGAH